MKNVSRGSFLEMVKEKKMVVGANIESLKKLNFRANIKSFFFKPSDFLTLYGQTIFLKDFFTGASISRNFSERYKTPSGSQNSEFGPWVQNEINYFALNLQSETKSWLLRTRRFFISSGKVSVVTAPCKKVCQKNNLSPHGEEIRWFSKKRTSTFPYIHLGPATLFTFSDAIGPSPAP